VPRHLPVIQTPPPEDAEASARSPWSWALIGAGFTVTLWLPLATLASWMQSRALIMLSFALAALLAGVLVGRFGLRAGLRHVALGGMAGGCIGFVLALLGGAVSSWTLAVTGLAVLAAAGASFSAAGGVLGRALRKRAKL
jgi:tRNA-(ms[2]io[6]A)-hydroxylase